MSFDFRASNPDGIILYTAINNDKQADFIVCNLLNGNVSCGFSAGGGILRLTSADAVYSDGTWHTVSFVSCLDFFCRFFCLIWFFGLFSVVVYIIVVFVIFCIFLCVRYFNFF